MKNRTFAITAPDSISFNLGNPFFIYGFFGLLSIFLLISYVPLQPDSYKIATGDAVKYIAMSIKPLAPTANVFAFRILSPLLAQYLMRWFGFSPDLSWAILSGICTWGILCIFYKILRDYTNISAFVAFFTTVMLGFTFWYTLFNLADVWLVDPMNNLLICLGLYLALMQRFWPWFIVMVVGFINKEVALYAAPVFPLIAFVRSGSLKDRGVIQGVLALVVLAALFLTFRTILERLYAASGSSIQYSLFHGEYNTPSMLDLIRYNLLGERRPYEIFKIFGFLWIVCAFFPFAQWKDSNTAVVAKEITMLLVYFIVLLFISRFLANNTQRVFTIMSPVVLMAAGLMFDSMFRRENAFFLPVLLLAYIITNTDLGTADTIILVNMGALILLAILFRQREIELSNQYNTGKML